ncbi:hypothetical protein CC80DRAFT_493347 [Byssothecium circinans]|uniref:Uncharacterized protein n=1 Tax=Byssothecium circinans TaxID=147558 RepID=A0A6A5TT94_9PLEO|nr:hypothetical protein CC80DRAFT_493347 [Byssothecium circinans]
MGSWDCYCALCSGPLGYGVKFARRKRAAKQGKEGTGHDSYEAMGDAEEEESKEEGEVQFDSDYGDDDDDEDDDYEGEHRYNPEVLKKKDTAWVKDCRCLAKADSDGSDPRIFLSRRGTYDDYGVFSINRSDEDNETSSEDLDPNDPGAEDFDCYEHQSMDGWGFPMHEACWSILAQRLLNHSDGTRINRAAMFSTLDRLQDQHNSFRDLNLDYGDIEGPDQIWICQPGQEYIVCNPGFNVLTTQEILKILPTTQPTPSLDLTGKVRNDPFRRLPYDILLMVMPYLPAKQRIALMNASWHVHMQTRNTSFWTWMIRKDVLPWFPELKQVFSDPQFSPTNFNFKDVYFYLRHATNTKTNMQGPLMGIANRRRIWNTIKLRHATNTKTNMQGPLMGIANRRRIWNTIKPIIPLYRGLVDPPLAEEEKGQMG